MTPSISTAALLPAVLLVVVVAAGCGGDDGGDADAEVTEPALPAWDVAFAPIQVGLTNRSAIALPANDVLLPGGVGGGVATNSWLLLGIDEGTWTQFSATTALLGNQVKTRLDDGRILLSGTGPSDLFQVPIYYAEPESYLVDPEGPTVTATGSLNEARSHHMGARLDDGRVLVAGGAGAGSDPGPDNVRPVLSSAEIFDPAAGAWETTGAMAEARYAASATRLDDGRVLIAGGIDGGESRLAKVEIYDPASGTFSAAASMSTARAWHIAERLPSGRVLVAGGQDSASTVTASAEIFDPETGEWTETDPLPVPSADAASLVLPSGLVLVTGGYAVFDSFETMLGQTMSVVYDEAAGRFWEMDPLSRGRFAHSLVRLSDGRAAVIAGRRDEPGRHASEIEVTTEPLE